jgi:hypothetical protein
MINLWFILPCLVAARYSFIKSLFGMRRCAPRGHHPPTYCIIGGGGGGAATDDENTKFCGRHIEKIAPQFENKKHITISPGGFKGFYMLGVTAYIKTFFEVEDDYIFSGASAGSWNALTMSYIGEPYTLYPRIRKILYSVNELFKSRTILYMQKQLRAGIMEKFRDDEFDFQKLFIGVTTNTIPNPFFRHKTHIYTNFSNLDEAVDACMASSHIPFITGGHKYIYRGIDAYDGGFSKNPFLPITPYLKITPNIWGAENETYGLESFTTLFFKHKYDLIELFDMGFLDSFENHDELARLFTARKPPPAD